MKKVEKRLTICRAEEWNRGILCGLTVRENRVVLDIRKNMVGAILMAPVDSCENGFIWDRVIVDADLPEGSGIMVYAFASDDPEPEKIRAAKDMLKKDAVTFAEQTAYLHTCFGFPVSHDRDCLLKCRGRYLWLCLWLISGGSEDPGINRVVIRMGGDHMTDYLPGIYQNHDLTRRFLSVFNSIHTDMDRQIELLPAAFDYTYAGKDMLRFLAGCLGIEDSGLSLVELRARIAEAMEEYESMYTPAGIRRSIERLTGRTPVLLEYKDVDPNRPDCPDPALFRQLFSDDPYRFYVILPDDTFSSAQEITRFIRAMEPLIPAGVTMELVSLEDCRKLGKFSFPGMDNITTDFRKEIIGEQARIDQ